MKTYKGYKIKVDNKMRGAYGDMNESKKLIRIHKKRHKTKKNLANTIVHEKMHVDHPKMWEKTVRKKTSKIIGKASKKAIERINQITMKKTKKSKKVKK